MTEPERQSIIGDRPLVRGDRVRGKTKGLVYLDLRFTHGTLIHTGINDRFALVELDDYSQALDGTRLKIPIEGLEILPPDEELPGHVVVYRSSMAPNGMMYRIDDPITGERQLILWVPPMRQHRGAPPVATVSNEKADSLLLKHMRRYSGLLKRLGRS